MNECMGKQKARSYMEVWNGVEEGLKRRDEQEREATGDGLAHTTKGKKAKFHRGHGVYKGPSFILRQLLKRLLCIWTCERYSSIQK